MSSVAPILCPLLQIYIFVLLGRAILSFFPIGPESGLFGVQRVLMQLTEPVLGPLRQVIPPLGMFDMSFLVLFLLLQFVHAQICGGRALF